MDMLVARANEDDREGDGFLRGLAVAVVTDNGDPENLGRVRVRLAFHNNNQESYWARVAAPMAMADRGWYSLPEVDDEVVVGFEQGDITMPVVVGSVYSGRNPPPSNNSDGANNTRIFKSRANSELHFNDDSPASVELKLEDGKSILFDDSGITITDETNTIQIESSSGKISISSSGDIDLQAGGSLSMQASSSISMNASGTVTINGAMVQIN